MSVMNGGGLQAFIIGLQRSYQRLLREGRAARPVAEWSYSWTNMPTPAAFRPPTNQDFLTNSPNLQEKINELFVGLFRYNHILKRMRKWVRDTVARMRHVKWAETEYAPPRSIRGGRHGGRGYREARAEFSYNQGNNRITRQQRRRYSDPYLLDYLRRH